MLSLSLSENEILVISSYLDRCTKCNEVYCVANKEDYYSLETKVILIICLKCNTSGTLFKKKLSLVLPKTMVRV